MGGFLGQGKDSGSYSYDESKQMIRQLNHKLKQSERQLHFCLEFAESKLKYEPQDWRKSTVQGRMQAIDPRSIGHKSDFAFEEIHLCLADVLQAYELLRHFKAEEQTPTPKQATDEDQCCICLNERPKMVLPCSVLLYIAQHSFCDSCTTKYIVEVEQRKCPKCRMEFKGSSKTVAKRIFTVIKEDEDYFCEVRQLLLDLLKERNSRVIKKIEPALLAIANAQAN